MASEEQAIDYSDLTDWDLGSFFPEFRGEAHRAFLEALASDIADLKRTLGELEPVASGNAASWARGLAAYESISARFSHVAVFASCLASVDARSEAFQQAEGEVAVLSAHMERLGVEIVRALRDVTDADLNALLARPELDGASYYVRRLRDDARRSMEPAMEELAADLAVDGLHAWGRLYDRIAGTLDFEMRYPTGKVEVLPMAQRRSLLGDANRDVRRAAFEGGNRAWERVEDVACAALNHIAGTRHTLYRYRGVDHFLDAALFDAAISRKTLDAMFEAVRDRNEIARRYLRIKAKLMNVSEIAWYDLDAPLPLADERRYGFDEACTMLRSSFSRAYPALGRYFEDALKKRWIEWTPRKAKRPGAYCTGSELTGESRVFMTFQGSLGDVSTLAHEVGHAFHSDCMRDLRVFARQYPMTLAESASTFAEAILTDGLLADPEVSDTQKALLLTKTLNDTTAFLLDIPVRFEFERAFYEARQSGEVSVSRMKSLMTAAQRRVFGGVLAESGMDPYFWASKLHFFITGVSFYNFPYTFGFLLSRGLYVRFKEEGAPFLSRYEALLRDSGSAMAHEVVQRSIGQDLEKPDFWAACIDSFSESLETLEGLLHEIGAFAGDGARG